jgi:hypothetical protein
MSSLNAIPPFDIDVPCILGQENNNYRLAYLLLDSPPAP